MTVKCPMCGAPLDNNTCGYCGYKEEKSSVNSHVPPQSGPTYVSPQPAPTYVPTQIIINNQATAATDVVPGISKKSKTVALLLCIFLGILGIHRFYVGKVGTGILYLFTYGLFGIGWIVDIILIVTGSFKDHFGLPLRKS